MRRNMPIYMAVMFIANVARAQQGGAVAAPSGEVRMAVVGPEGAPLANTLVDIHPADTTRGTPPLPEAHVKTDAQGLAVFQWPAGEMQLWVTAHAVKLCYGATGTVIVKGNGTVTAPLPALVPLAHVEGTVPEGARKAGLEIRAVRSGSFGRWGEGATVAVDGAGHFALDLISGEWYLAAQAGNQRTAEGALPMILWPGMRIEGVALKVVPIPPAPATEPAPAAPAPARPVVIAHGTVRDVKGQAVAGASVYVSAENKFSSRDEWGGRPLFETKTDAAGHYEVSTEQRVDSGEVYVLAPGKPLAWAYLATLRGRGLWNGAAQGPDAPPADTDLVVADAAGEMDVRVLGPDGKPATGSSVILNGLDENAEIWSITTQQAYEPLRRALFPAAQADAQGVAHLRNLPAGRYELVATSGAPSAQSFLSWASMTPGPYGRMKGLAVAAGQTAHVSVQLHAQAKQGSVRLVKPDGTPDELAGQAYHYQRVGASGETSSSRGLVNGLLAIDVNQAGLWQVEYQYREGARGFASRPPFVGAGAFFAVSNLLPAQPPTVLQGRPTEPGSIEVGLQDDARRPVKGFVQLVNDSDLPMLSGATDAKGQVHFAAVPEQETVGPWNRYAIQATVPGVSRLDLRELASPAEIPPDDALAKRVEYLPLWITAAPDTPQTRTLQPARLSYIRGKVLDAPKPDPSGQEQFYIYLGRGRLDVPAGATVRYFPETGDYIAGPMNVPEVDLGMTVRKGSRAETSHQRVALMAGNVTRLDVHAPRLSGMPNAADGPFMDAQGKFNATVYLADGKTVAGGAEVRGLYPGGMYPVILARADARGHLSAYNQGVISRSGDSETMPEGSPEGFVAVASLPGVCGAVIVPTEGPLEFLDNPLPLVLPPALKARGAVAVEGITLPVQGAVRVLAAYTGKGKLNPLLSVETTPNSDGTFELAGLTPGHYQVQAALDDLWFSEAVEIDVADRDPPALSLKIGAPGAPTVLWVGPGGVASVGRPDGPLMREAAVVYRADATGNVYLPTLEAGEHLVSANGREKRLTVPRVTEENTLHPQVVELGSPRQ